MPFRRIEAGRLSEAVVAQIEALILRGVLRPGDRLPPERELSERLGVSRPSLREAVATLAGRGLLSTRAGSGVTVAASLDAAFPDALVQLFGRHDEALLDHVAFRRDVEGLAAARAAADGSATDLAVVASVFAKMEAAHERRDAAVEAGLDARFHTAIVEASHNAVMLHVMRATLGLLREGVAANRTAMFARRTTGAALLGQHRAIAEAIGARDPDAARAAVEAHLDYVREALLAERAAQRQEATARLRLAREGG